MLMDINIVMSSYIQLPVNEYNLPTLLDSLVVTRQYDDGLR